MATYQIAIPDDRWTKTREILQAFVDVHEHTGEFPQARGEWQRPESPRLFGVYVARQHPVVWKERLGTVPISVMFMPDSDDQQATAVVSVSGAPRDYRSIHNVYIEGPREGIVDILPKFGSFRPSLLTVDDVLDIIRRLGILVPVTA